MKSEKPISRNGRNERKRKRRSKRGGFGNVRRFGGEKVPALPVNDSPATRRASFFVLVVMTRQGQMIKLESLLAMVWVNENDHDQRYREEIRWTWVPMPFTSCILSTTNALGIYPSNTDAPKTHRNFGNIKLENDQAILPSRAQKVEASTSGNVIPFEGAFVTVRVPFVDEIVGSSWSSHQTSGVVCRRDGDGPLGLGVSIL
ncbi:hypothetical protein M413DRAFT_14481 [Hebeloma cylindrosporum]|uniref:Uncharacterized protein n=1 Tax=Hebeloma cylindrosporum TaxID=76867 RepID=A0A0C2Y385_HEBCY|nr:hypothetical protein M413DRAFT_14481 [Hebeloma cylindrosporum h7]